MARSAKTTTFKYITVEPDDSELVIVAGSHKPDAAAASRDDAAMPAQDQNQPTGKGTSAPKSAKPSAEKPAEQVNDAFRETTLDDLDHEPMPKMQRAVLLGIAVLVIAFVAYVLFF